MGNAACDGGRWLLVSIGWPFGIRGAGRALASVIARGEMEFITLAAVVGVGGFLSTLFRLVFAWLRSRHPRRVRMRVGGAEVTLDLSNPTEAAKYLEQLQTRPREGS
ncbi:hypothetical protein [Streptomyces sp. NPDC051776]|uniref:effector-associated constant component EACC1 n=1 Tax=Streptomyces sp. NPDC051776 TaxID=3155414 RepID=UPI00343F5B51